MIGKESKHVTNIANDILKSITDTNSAMAYRNCHQRIYILCEDLVSITRFFVILCYFEYSARYLINKKISKISLNTLKTRYNGRHVADGILKCNFLNGNI